VTKSDLKRFWEKVKVDPATGCWIWTAAVRTWKKEPWDGGFGAFRMDGKTHRAHKIAYRILFGCFPPRGKVLLHGCDNRRCVNVLEHIQPGTQLQNVADMLSKGRSIHQRRKATILQGDQNAKPATQEGTPEPVRTDRPIEVDPAAALEGAANHQWYLGAAVSS
jgi:hypothetical protein